MAKHKQSSAFKINHQDIELESRQSEHIFFGQINIIGVKLGRPSQRITLNQTNLKINSAEITHKDKKNYNVHETARINHLKKRGEVRLHTKTMLYPGQYELKISYTGKLNKDILDEVFITPKVHIDKHNQLNLKKVLLTNLMPHIKSEE